MLKPLAPIRPRAGRIAGGAWTTALLLTTALLPGHAPAQQGDAAPQPPPAPPAPTQPASGQPAAQPAAPLAGRNLIVITVDTTRADHISCYGNPGSAGLTPNLDRLAEDGILFLSAFSQTNCTNPSHASIFTGLYAIDAKIMNNQTSLPDFNPNVDTLPAAFQRAGYRTAGFPATPHASDTTLKLPGFDEPNHVLGEPKAGEMVDKALKWLDRPSDKPFFIWLHLFDPHMKYEAPEEFRQRFYTGDPTAGTAPPYKENEYFMRSPKVVPEQFGEVRDMAYPPAMYKAEVNYTDHELGRFVAGLKERGLYDKTGLVLVADHGESLGEHDVYFDHFGMYEQSFHVPMIMRFPGLPTGARVRQTVTHIDIVPTLAQLYGVKMAQPYLMHGLSLVELVNGAESAAVAQRTTLIHEDAHNRQIMVRRGEWKLVVQIREPKYPGDAVSLFNLDQDPDEKVNLAEKHPEIVAQLRPLVQRWVEQGKWEIKNAEDEEGLSAEEIQRRKAERARLEALGYIEKEDDDDAKPAGDPGASAPEARQLSIRQFGDAALSPELNLSPDQVSRITAIVGKTRRDSAEAVKAGRQGDVRDLRQKMHTDIRAVLTEAQRTKLDEIVRKKAQDASIDDGG